MLMKRTPLMIMLAVLSTSLFTACHHENPDPVTPDPTDTSQISKNLLAKTVLTSGSGVTTKIYQYDAQNRLAWYSNTSTEPGYFEDTSKIVWDASGHIAQIIYSSDTSTFRFPDPKVDSVVYNVFYDAAASKYTYKLTQYTMFPNTAYAAKFKDSAVYTYDAQSHISQVNDYYFDYKTTKTYVKWATYDYTYNDKGDLTNWKTTYYNIDNNNTNYPFEKVYTYEEKGVNVLSLGNDAIVIGIPENYGAHAPKTITGTYPLNPEYNSTLTFNYNYNTLYRPLSAAITDAADNNAKSTMVYTYQ